MAIIYGSALRRDGSKINGTATISTSWNSSRAYPYDGQYQLDLGSNPATEVMVYVDGEQYTEVYVNGNTRVDVRAD